MSAVPQSTRRLAAWDTSAEGINQLNLVGKYLKALRDGSFDPQSSGFQAGWVSDQAPDVDPAEVYGMIQEHLCGDRVSHDTMANCLRLFGWQLSQAASWPLLALPMLVQFAPEMHGLALAVTRMLLSNACLFSLPQLTPVPAVLLTRKWNCDGCSPLSAPLWRRVAEFLVPNTGRSWWAEANHPLLFMRVHGDSRVISQVIGMTIAAPSQCNLDNFIPCHLAGCLEINDIKVRLRWDDMDSSRISEWLGNLAGVRLSTVMDMDTAVTAAGVYLRLVAHVPTLLVGDGSRSSDEFLSSIISELLTHSAETPVRVLNVADMTATNLTALQTVTETALLLLRIDPSALRSAGGKELAALQSALFTRRHRDSPWMIGSIHLAEASVVELQERLPRTLREAAVFL